MKKYIPGLFISLIISIIAFYINESLKAFVSLESVTIAIVIGIIINNFIKIDSKFNKGLNFASGSLLNLGIILLGFKINFSLLASIGKDYIVVLLFFIPFILYISMFLGKKLGINPKLSSLLGVGSSICGSSAIVAIAPVINADEDDTIVAATIINLMGVIGVLSYSFVINIVDLPYHEYGVFSGLSLQGVSHSLAAAFSHGEQAGQVATVIKMSRVLFLAPVAIVLGLVFKGDKKTKSSLFPKYLIFFLFAILINSLNILPKYIVDILKDFSNHFILIAMSALGLKVNLKAFKTSGLKSLINGFSVFLIIIVISFLVVKYI